MRKLTFGNKKSIAMFSIIIVCIIILLLVFLNFAIKQEKQEYFVGSGTIVYDYEYSPIKLDADAVIKQNWNGNYYLKINDIENTYNLGKQVITYNSTKVQLNVFGKIYKVLQDGQVIKLNENTEISDLNEDSIYKLDDRKYLVVGGKIINQNGYLNTENFLLVVLDKSGNTLLVNENVNSKTISKMIIETSSFKFDVPNEKLIYQNNVIDLKKIIGSTNEYIEPEKEIKEDEKDKKQDDDQKAQDNLNNNVQNNNVNNNITNNNNQTNININQSDNKDDDSSNSIKKSTLEKYVDLKSVTSGATYIDLNYQVIDPENTYQTVYVFIEGNNYTKTIALNRESTLYRIMDLTPNSDYKVVLGYREVQEDSTIKDITSDVVNIRTNKINSTINIVKVTSNKVYFNLKIDPNFAFESADICLYINGEKISTINANTYEGVDPKGWDSSVNYSFGTDIELKVENAVYNGKTINTDIKAKFRKY